MCKVVFEQRSHELPFRPTYISCSILIFSDLRLFPIPTWTNDIRLSQLEFPLSLWRCTTERDTLLLHRAIHASKRGNVNNGNQGMAGFLAGLETVSRTDENFKCRQYSHPDLLGREWNLVFRGKLKGSIKHTRVVFVEPAIADSFSFIAPLTRQMRVGTRTTSGAGDASQHDRCRSLTYEQSSPASCVDQSLLSGWDSVGCQRTSPARPYTPTNTRKMVLGGLERRTRRRDQRNCHDILSFGDR